MTGPEHYREAEHLLDQAKDTRRRYSIDTAAAESEDHRIRAHRTALAQAHATLALAAAVAFAPDENIRVWWDWDAVAGRSTGVPDKEDTTP